MSKKIIFLMVCSWGNNQQRHAWLTLRIAGRPCSLEGMEVTRPKRKIWELVGNCESCWMFFGSVRTCRDFLYTSFMIPALFPIEMLNAPLTFFLENYSTFIWRLACEILNFGHILNLTEYFLIVYIYFLEE